MNIIERKRVLITNTLREIFVYDIQKSVPEFKNTIVTITNSYLLDAGKLIKIYINLFSINKSDTLEQHLLTYLNKNKKLIRYKLGNKLSNKLKFIPNIDFYIDDTRCVSKEIETLLAKINFK